MEGILGIVVLLLIGILIIPIIIASGTNSRVREMSTHLKHLEALLADLGKQISSAGFDTSRLSGQPTVQPLPDEPTETGKMPAEEEFMHAVPEHVIPAFVPDPAPEPASSLSFSEEDDRDSSGQEPEVLIQEVLSPKVDQPLKETPRIKKDLERFIGEKLMSLVGIGILVLGIFFTVKWAIDKKLIGDAGKVLIGVLSGTLLIGLAHRIRKAYHAFSSILTGGGLAVLYFTVYIAFQDYHLLSQIPAFIAMVGVTIGAVALALLYDRVELAVIALIGGFATPFFVSSNDGNYQVLFAYLLVLNVGMFILAGIKKWNLVNMISYVATVLIFAGWLNTKFDPGKGQTAGGFLFASLFYLVFFGMNVIYNIQHKTKFRVIEIGMLLSNTFLYFAAGLYFLGFIRDGYCNGVFTLCLAAFNFAFAYRFYKKGSVDQNLIYLLIGLVLTFVSLSAPIQLNGNYITLFWSAEMVLLYWLGQKSGIQLIRNTSIVVLGLALISLAMDWTAIYQVHSGQLVPVMINRAFITGVILLIGLLLKRKLVMQDNEQQTILVVPVRYYGAFLKGLKVLVLYLVLLLEVYNQVAFHSGSGYFTTLVLWIYHYLFAAVLFVYANKEQFFIRKCIAGSIGFLLLLYLLAGRSIANVQSEIHAGSLSASLFVWHYAVPVLALFNLFLLIRFVHTCQQVRDSVKRLAPWFFTFIGVLIFSNEIIRIGIVLEQHNNPSAAYAGVKAIKIALPILWSICSLVLMLIGMRLRLKTYRIVSISLFALTIAKLFLYDISDIGQGGKIAAFVILGIILLVVSFLYQKIKGLFTDDTESKDQAGDESQINYTDESIEE